MSIRKRKSNKAAMAARANGINKAVGARIRARRLAMREPTSMEALGVEIGASTATVSRLESGETAAEPSVLLRLSKVFGCQPGDFLNGIEP